MLELMIIIISWNTEKLLKQCLDSLYSDRHELKCKIVVVDNNSTDGTIEMVSNNFPDVKLIINSENLGYAKANNIALKEETEKFKYVLFLNSDVITNSKSIKNMELVLDKNNEIGAAGPSLRLYNGKLQTGVGGYFPSKSAIFNYSLFLNHINNNIFKSIYLSQNNLKNYTYPYLLDWVSGACLLCRYDLALKIGGFPENYFMYSEDIEFCFRIKNLGYKVAYLPFIEVIHYHGASSKNNKKVNTMWIDALLKFCKYHKIDVKAIKKYLYLGFVIRYFIYSILMVFNKKYKIMSENMKYYANTISQMSL